MLQTRYVNTTLTPTSKQHPIYKNLFGVHVKFEIEYMAGIDDDGTEEWFSLEEFAGFIVFVGSKKEQQEITFEEALKLHHFYLKRLVQAFKEADPKHIQIGYCPTQNSSSEKDMDVFYKWLELMSPTFMHKKWTLVEAQDILESLKDDFYQFCKVFNWTISNTIWWAGGYKESRHGLFEDFEKLSEWLEHNVE